MASGRVKFGKDIAGGADGPAWLVAFVVSLVALFAIAVLATADPAFGAAITNLLSGLTILVLAVAGLGLVVLAGSNSHKRRR